MVTSGMSKEQVKLIKATIAKGATDDELSLFLEICNRRQLDPFARQIYFVKGVGTVTSIDGLRVNAERSKSYVPSDTTYQYDKGGNLLSATVSAKKQVAGVWHTISETAFLAEFKQGSPIWNRMPHVMLAKCAEARLLRRGWPEDTSGLYTQEEMGVDVHTGEVIDAVAEPVAPAALPLQAPPSKAEVDTDYTAKLLRLFASKGVTSVTLERFMQRAPVEWQEPEHRILSAAWKQLKAGEKTAFELFAPRAEEVDDELPN
jgi:phage recombination protein Bet